MKTSAGKPQMYKENLIERWKWGSGPSNVGCSLKTKKLEK